MEVDSPVEENVSKAKVKKENPLVSIAFNIVIPNLILIKFANDEYLGIMNGFWVALAFPLLYGIYDFISRKNINIIAGLGFVNVLLTGGIGLLKLGGIWFAVKEAAIPAVIGLAIIVTQKTKRPLIREIFYNDQILNIEKIESALETSGRRREFQFLLNRSTYIIFASFIFSALVNFALARYLIKSPPGTEMFNEEVGTMNTVSYLVIALPCTVMLGYAMWKFGSGLRKLTNLEWTDIMRQG